MKNWACIGIAMGLTHGVLAATIITSDGAWTTTDVVEVSNGGSQTNFNSGGTFNSFAGAVFSSSGTNQVMYMSSLSNTYEVGKTYIYQVEGLAAAAARDDIQNVELIAGTNTSGIAGTLVSGPNNTGVYGVNDRVAISGSYAVEAGDPIIGQRVGMKLYSSGFETRFHANGTSFIATVASSHTGTLYETEFDLDGGGDLITTANPIDMEVVDGAGLIISGGDSYFRMNLNSTGDRNTVTLDAQADSFRADILYTVSFLGNRSINDDPLMKEVNVILGGSYTKTLTFSSFSKTNYSFTVNAEDVGLVGKDLSIKFIPAGSNTVSGANQYRVYNLELLGEDVPVVSTTNGTPHSWLNDYYAPVGDYEAQDLTDTDGDGFLAWQEYQLGTNPTNALSLLAITEAVPAAGGEFVVTWQSAEGRSYNVLTNINLVMSGWGTNAAAIPSAGAETSYTTTVGNAVNFFQVELD